MAISQIHSCLENLVVGEVLLCECEVRKKFWQLNVWIFKDVQQRLRYCIAQNFGEVKL